MGGRAVEGTGLESRQARKGLVGSNPTRSANTRGIFSASMGNLGHIPSVDPSFLGGLGRTVASPDGGRLRYPWPAAPAPFCRRTPARHPCPNFRLANACHSGRLHSSSLLKPVPLKKKLEPDWFRPYGMAIS